MRIIVKTNNLTRGEWLKYRTMGIGGSDASIIAGINPFKSVYQLWLEKTGQTEPEQTDSEYAHFGTLLEPVVRREFTERSGIKVRAKHALLQSTEYPFMLANLDGIIREQDGSYAIFEAKTASAFKEEIWESGIPSEYMLQIQHYMAVTGAGRTYIAALVGGNHFFYHVVERLNSKRKQRAYDRVMEETCMEIITASYETPDFVEVHGTAGGDDLCYRVYDDGRIYTR